MHYYRATANKFLWFPELKLKQPTISRKKNFCLRTQKEVLARALILGCTVQRGATRFILGRDYSEYERLSKLNLLPLEYRREINDLVFFFECLENICKLIILDYVSFRSSTKLLRNVENLKLDVPFSRSDVFKNKFFVQICHLWNNLPLNIRESNTLLIFCKNLIAFYYDKFNVDFL